jgi:hypothetical protein
MHLAFLVRVWLCSSIRLFLSVYDILKAPSWAGLHLFYRLIKFEVSFRFVLLLHFRFSGRMWTRLSACRSEVMVLSINCLHFMSCGIASAFFWCYLFVVSLVLLECTARVYSASLLFFSTAKRKVTTESAAQSRIAPRDFGLALLSGCGER